MKERTTAERGTAVGVSVGAVVGTAVGVSVGVVVGTAVGVSVGAAVGTAVAQDHLGSIGLLVEGISGRGGGMAVGVHPAVERDRAAKQNCEFGTRWREHDVVSSGANIQISRSGFKAQAGH